MRRLVVTTLLALGTLAAPASAADVAPAAGSEGDTVTFTVTRSPAESVTATITPGTASGDDHGAPTVTFPSGAAEGTVTVPASEDAAAETDETFTLTVEGSLSGSGSATGTIVDDDPRALSVRDATVSEAAGAVDVVVEALPPSAGAPASSVPFSTTPGNAADGQDLAPTSGILQIPAGASQATIRVPIVDDGLDEDDESFAVGLGTPSNATVADGQATVTITNDDLRSLSIGDVTVREGDDVNDVARVPITLSAPTFRTVSVSFATIDGLARAPRDYLGRLGSVTIPAGQTSAIAELAIVSDDTHEREEAFGVRISRPLNAAITKQAAAVTITDDDGPEGDETPPNVRVRALRLRGPRITARVSCPRGELRCRGRLALFTVADRRSPVRSLRRERRIGSVRYTLTGGRARTVRIRVPLSIRRAARRAGRLRVQAFAVTDDASGNTDTTTATRTLRLRR